MIDYILISCVVFYLLGVVINMTMIWYEIAKSAIITFEQIGVEYNFFVFAFKCFFFSVLMNINFWALEWGSWGTMKSVFTSQFVAHIYHSEEDDVYKD